MSWQGVTSSDLSEYKYDPMLKTLSVRFKTGAVYDYNNVESEIVEGLTSASSKGEFFHWNIRGRYLHRKQ